MTIKVQDTRRTKQTRPKKNFPSAHNSQKTKHTEQRMLKAALEQQKKRNHTQRKEMARNNQT